MPNLGRPGETSRAGPKVLVRLSQEDFARLKALSDRQGRTMSAILRESARILIPLEEAKLAEFERVARGEK